MRPKPCRPVKLAMLNLRRDFGQIAVRVLQADSLGFAGERVGERAMLQLLNPRREGFPGASALQCKMHILQLVGRTGREKWYAEMRMPLLK